MTSVDFIIIAIILIYAWIGFKSGVFRTMGGLLGSIVGFVAASVWYEDLGRWFQDSWSWNLDWSYVAAFILVYLVFNQLVGWLFLLLQRMFDVMSILPTLKVANWAGGLILGLFEGLLLASFLVMMLGRYPQVTDGFEVSVNESVLAGPVEVPAELVIKVLPGGLDELQSVVDTRKEKLDEVIQEIEEGR